MEISIEKIIEIVTREVVAELSRRGVKISGSINSEKAPQEFSDRPSLRAKSEIIDMSKYKSPILTEQHLIKLNELVGEVVVPKGTVITPKARELIKRKNLSVRFE